MFDTLQIHLTDDKSYPKYIQLRDQLEEYIKTNNITPGEQLPDIISMCKIAGLSNRSVERAYIMLINDGICFRRPKKGTFVRDSAPVLSECKPRVCAIFSPANPMRLEKDDITGRIYAGIQNEARQGNIDLLILSERSLSVYLDNNSFEFIGVIILSWYNLEEAAAVVSKYPNVRFFFLNYHLQDFEKMPPNAFGIFNDDLAGGFEATDYLVSRGRRKLRAITVKLHDDNYERRIEGFLLAARANNLEVTSKDIYTWTRNNLPSKDEQFEIGRELLTQLLEATPDTDAIFCTNDLLAAGVVSALDKLKLRTQIEVIGYDNILSYLSANGHFSTVAINLEEMGKRAIKLLLDSAFNYPRVINLPPQLLPRKTAPSAE